MELQIQTQELAPIQANLAQIKEYVGGVVAKYQGATYSDDQIKLAKQDRADLKRLKEDIETKRKAVKAKWNEPYFAFEREIKSITALIDTPVELIDSQVKDYEQRKRAERRGKLAYEFDKWNPLGQLLNFDNVLKDEWLKLSITDSKAKAELAYRLEQISKDIALLENTLEPDFRTECLSAYTTTFDVSTALARQSFLKAEKAKQEAVLGAVEPIERPAKPQPQEIEEDIFASRPKPADPKNYPETRRFIVTATPIQIDVLLRFARENNIKIREVF